MTIIKKQIVLILPYLNVNTTSAERFKSFIRAFELNNSLNTNVITFDYGIKKSYFLGLETTPADSFSPKNYQIIKVKLNLIQSLGVRFLNNDFKKLWRIFQLLHLIIYQKDIFYPNFSLNDLNIELKNNDYIFTSGSHFSLFEIAENLSKKFGLKLILDYRDPWTLGYNPIDGLSVIHYLKILISRKKEIKLLNSAFLITTVSESLKSFFPLHYQSKIKIFANGSNFLIEEVEKQTQTKTFQIVYAGTIYREQLQDETFFESLQGFVVNKKTENIKLKFLGVGDNKSLKKLIKKYNLKNITSYTHRLKRDEFLLQMNNTSIFLHLKYGNKKDVISSKQAEYLMFNRPILLPVSDNGDIAESILKNKAGFVCNNQSEVLKALESIWTKFKNQENLYLNRIETYNFNISREKIAKDFVNMVLNPPNS
ncbi:hypothetical protein [Pedobacter alpinus]|uniref:Glycosyl transferase family 1 domain-containing protein n=1 Tax=Pedobacter alpinus TaxID=1590643 RepID=A0ABW5TQL4_9SPHI